MTCKDCAHYEVCEFWKTISTTGRFFSEGECRYFKDKSKIVELPCNVGDTVYYVFANKILEKQITQYREILRKSGAVDKWYCVNFSENETFDNDDIGKTVFLSPEEAEKALKEREVNE